MYIPARHAEERLEVLHALIEDHPLGALVRLDSDGLAADHLPFELVRESTPRGILRAHVARANPLWRQADAPVLVLFQGPSGYVSPARYDLQAIGGRMVPTWDYALVHAHGHGWSVDDAPRGYIDGLVQATVGIEIVIDRLEGKWKGSQPAR